MGAVVETAVRGSQRVFYRLAGQGPDGQCRLPCFPSTPTKSHDGPTSAALLSSDRGKRRIGDARRVLNGKDGQGIQGLGGGEIIQLNICC